MSRPWRVAACSGLLILGAMTSPLRAEVVWKTFDATPYFAEPAECDRLAAHPDDPFRLAPGVSTSVMDRPAAIRACRAELAKSAGNPRLAYQLGRALTYDGRVTEALPYLEQSASAGYPQSLFVLGYLYLEGAYRAPRNVCRAAELIREAALYGRLAALLGYPAYVLNGRFDSCARNDSTPDLLAFVNRAREQRLEFYPAVLAETLQQALRRRSESDEREATSAAVTPQD